jgi:lipopolysaccharide assembly protein A
MQFLKTLFWVMLAVVLVLFARANWNVVTLELWGNLQADVKLPVLVIGAFLLGFVPTLVVYRARIWSLKRRLEAQAQAHVANMPGAPTAAAPPARSASAPEAERPIA